VGLPPLRVHAFRRAIPKNAATSTGDERQGEQDGVERGDAQGSEEGEEEKEEEKKEEKKEGGSVVKWNEK